MRRGARLVYKYTTQFSSIRIHVEALGFRPLWLDFRSETGFLSTLTAQSVSIFIAHQMNSVFLWSICFHTVLRNQHFLLPVLLLQVKGLGVPFRMQVHGLSAWTYPCVVWTRCSHQQFDSWSQLSGLWTVMLHPFGILSVGGFHPATRFMRGWAWALLTSV